MSPQEDTLPHHLNTILLFCVLICFPRFPLVVSHHFYSEFKLRLRSQSEYCSCHLIMRRHYSDWISAVRLSDLFHLGWWLPLALAAVWIFAASMSPVSPYSSVALTAKLLTWLSGIVERKILLCPKCPSFPMWFILRCQLSTFLFVLCLIRLVLGEICSTARLGSACQRFAGILSWMLKFPWVKLLPLKHSVCSRHMFR